MTYFGPMLTVDHAGTTMDGGNKTTFDLRGLGNDDRVEGGKEPKLMILGEVFLREFVVAYVLCSLPPF